MKVINKGRGVHCREVVGISKLQEELPADWIAFTNLELALPYGGREIDLILIVEDRIIAVDLKDWHGKIESSGGAWSLNGKQKDGGSPVAKILNNARELWILLDRHLKQQASRTGGTHLSVDVPKVEGCVVLTATTDRSGIAPTESDKVFSIDLFIKMLKNPKLRVQQLGSVSPAFHNPGITTPVWKERWNRFFNVNTGPFRVSTRSYGGFRADSDAHSFQHHNEIFREYDVVDSSAAGSTGLLRRWDFTKAETRFQSEDARREIAGRERRVIAWLNDRNPDCETSILQPKVDDPDKGVEYWEVFDRRRRLQRLSDMSAEQITLLPRAVRIELMRQLVTRMKVVHDINAAHLDLGNHSVWIESPSILRISHLMAASFPELASLGRSRYQFLSSVTLPEDLFDTVDTNQRKDVYLLGCVAHTLFFGALPNILDAGYPAEWDSNVDSQGEFNELHGWIASALDWEPRNRFADAGAMLDALNAALDNKPSAASILKGLERFRTIASQRKLLSEYPVLEDLRDDARIGIWISEVNGKKLLVKLWKRESWGDQTREAPRLLAFLERAEALILDHPPGCALFDRVIWTGDALVLVQEFIDAPSLAAVNAQATTVWSDRVVTLSFLQKLAQTVMALHERQVTHGDLKPENILVSYLDMQPHPVLIDLLDFVPTDDGEQMTTQYAPASGGRFERDCFAVTKITEEMLAPLAWADSMGSVVLDAIDQIRVGPPENATLLPLIEAIDVALQPIQVAKARSINLVIPGAKESEFFSDEGKISLRLVHGRKLCLCGAVEQIVVELIADGKFGQARRQQIDQKQFSREQRSEFASIDLFLTIEDGVCYDLDAIFALLNEPEFAQLWADARATEDAWTSAKKQAGDSELNKDDGETDETEVTPESTVDQLAEDVAQQEIEACDIDVPHLWGRLLEMEAELTIGGYAIGQSAYNSNTQRHIVPFELESGAFDFARDDTVSILRLDQSGRWTRIGNLDLSASSASQLEIDTRRWAAKPNVALVADGQFLRFESHFDVTSRSRRRAATLRLLSRESRVSDMIDVFNPRKHLKPAIQETSLDLDELYRRYGLNQAQAIAFGNLIGVRPVGLLQGPPGTGKTRFIAALVHYALTHGLARNVLLSSQSHEAVNGAAEEVIKLFRQDDDLPSVLRVGHEGNVSEQLLPYHVARVEGLLKDRFRAELCGRLHIAGRALAIPTTLVDRLITIETILRPIVEKIMQLQQDLGGEDQVARIAALQGTLAEIVLDKLDLAEDHQPAVDETFLDALAIKMAARERFSNVVKVDHFRSVAELARDFMGSVSSRERTFETFLAGTRRIVAGTCVGLGRSTLGLTSTPFDLVIVDEAARCTASELAVPLQSGRWVVLVGDQQQLEPQHPSEVVRRVAKELRISEREITRSDFERVFESEYGRAAGFSLSEQYRMLPPIGTVVSSAFYGNRLTHGRTEPTIKLQTLPHPLEKPLTWITTDAFGDEARQSNDKNRKGGLHNPTEADLIIAMILAWDRDMALRDWISGQTDYPQTIGIICTYRSQSKSIQQKLKRVLLSEAMRATIKVDTVDSYQGKQNPIVILSLVRNNADGFVVDGVATNREGYLVQPNRLNVAVSRAMDRLVIVGTATRWRANSPVAEVINGFRKQEAAGQAAFVDGVELRARMAALMYSKKQSKAEASMIEEGAQ